MASSFAEAENGSALERWQANSASADEFAQ